MYLWYNYVREHVFTVFQIREHVFTVFQIREHVFMVLKATKHVFQVRSACARDILSKETCVRGVLSKSTCIPGIPNMGVCIRVLQRKRAYSWYSKSYTERERQLLNRFNTLLIGWRGGGDSREMMMRATFLS